MQKKIKSNWEIAQEFIHKRVIDFAKDWKTIDTELEKFLTPRELEKLRYHELAPEEAIRLASNRKQAKEEEDRKMEEKKKAEAEHEYISGKMAVFYAEMRKKHEQEDKMLHDRRKDMLEKYFCGAVILDTCIWETAEDDRDFFRVLRKFLLDSGNKIIVLADIYMEIEKHAASEDPSEAARGRAAKRMLEDFTNANLVKIDEAAFSGRYRHQEIYADNAIFDFCCDCFSQNTPCAIFTDDRSLRIRLLNKLEQPKDLENSIIKVLNWYDMGGHPRKISKGPFSYEPVYDEFYWQLTDEERKWADREISSAECEWSLKLMDMGINDFENLISRISPKRAYMDMNTTKAR